MNDAATLELRDIHLPDAISWWPLAPGWWLSLAAIIALIVILLIARQIYRSRQLRRDIDTELQLIKNSYQQTQDKIALASALSVLLRRASISYFQNTGRQTKYKNVAGLTGEQWLDWLDKTNVASASIQFQSETGKLLITAPYLPEDRVPDFDAQALIDLCEHWLRTSHYKQASAS